VGCITPLADRNFLRNILNHLMPSFYPVVFHFLPGLCFLHADRALTFSPPVLIREIHGKTHTNTYPSWESRSRCFALKVPPYKKASPPVFLVLPHKILSTADTCILCSKKLPGSVFCCWLDLERDALFHYYLQGSLIINIRYIDSIILMNLVSVSFTQVGK